MFRVEIPDHKIESITIAGCIGSLSMNTEDGLKFAKRYNLKLNQTLDNKVDVIFVLDGPADKENLEKFFEKLEEEDFDEELKEDFVNEFLNYPEQDPLGYLIHLLKDFIYFYDCEGITKDSHLLEGVMPVYLDFINMVKETGLDWFEETTQFKDKEIKTVKILKALNNSKAHCGKILKPILALLEDFPENPDQEFIAKLEDYLSRVADTPYPDFSFYPPLQEELAEKTLPSNEELNDLYLTISNLLNMLNSKFNFQSPKKWMGNTDSNQKSTYIKPTKFAIEFKKYYQNKMDLSPSSLFKNMGENFNSPQKENGSSKISKGYSPKIDWKTRAITPSTPSTPSTIQKVKKKLDFTDEKLQKQKQNPKSTPIPTPKPKPQPKSCLSFEQIELIKSHEDKLIEEINHGSFFYEFRKKQKASGLNKLVEYSYNPNMTIPDLVERIEAEFPEIRAGFFSSRTGNLLDKLLESEGIVSCCCF